MGITIESFEFLKPYLDVSKRPNICELGDQQFWVCSPFVDGTWAKGYFQDMGFNHVSIDINNHGGALPYDLDYPIEDKSLHNAFDIVTNFGTLEHVNNLYSGFKNMDTFCKDGGLMVHVTPSPNNWPNHGNHYLGLDFFLDLGMICNYDVLEIFQRTLNIGGEDSNQTHCVFMKMATSKFCSEEDFYKLPIFTS
jgi:hypothetical protein